AVLRTIQALKENVLSRMGAPDEVEDVFPMSDIQKGMIFASMMHPGGGVYHDQMLFPLPVVDKPLFTQALGLLVEKHGILRTVFNLNSYEEEVQIVYKKAAVAVDYHDLSGQSAQEAQEFIMGYLKEERERPFETETSFPWRSTLFKLSERTMVHLFQFHHALLDGWSFASFTTELYNVYSLLRDNRSLQLPKLKASYKDTILESLLDKSDESTAQFWRNELLDYKRLPIFGQDDTNQKHIVNYEPALLRRLREVAAELNLPVRSLFFGAYVFTMNMLTYENDLTVGMVTNLRPVTEDGDKVLGCFLNTIPFRYHVPGAPTTWRNFLIALDGKLRTLKGRDRLTLPGIAKAVGENSSQGNPFFDVLFNYVDFHVYDHLQLTEQEVAVGDLPVLESHEATNTYFDVSVSTTDGHLSVYYLLRKALKSAVSLSEVAGYFDSALRTIAANALAVINPAALLPAQASAKLLNEYNDTAADGCTNKTLVDLFAEQAAKTPENIAVAFGAESISYKALDEQSNQLAHYLRKKGVRAESLVVLYLQRSPEMLIAMLGILKAGGAYVPLDTQYPESRVAYVLDDTAAAFVLSHGGVPAVPQGDSTRTTILLDSEWAQIAQEPTTPLPVKVDPTHLAYVIYTSGSTGIPKGVMVEHRSVVNMVIDQVRELSFTQADHVLQFAPLSFDASVLEIFTSLAAGARLILAEKERMDSGEGFVDYLQQA
ncbi:MAG TPA: AMP-binding protein, partial [Hymenobacter sp.]|nr:AMP-binding protein [Hymenobacter sp.]